MTAPDAGERRSIPARDPGRAGLTMYSPLAAILQRAPITVPLTATTRETLQTMERMRVASIVITDPARAVPLGIFTLRDLVRRVTLPGGDLGAPIASVMTSGLITLEPHATAHQAALTMARNGVSRVVVVDASGRLVGVVEQNDLFGLQRLGVTQISGDIQAARTLDELERASLEIRRLTDALLAQGIAAETLSHYISTLNDLLTIRVVELTVDEHDLPTVPWCWIALGSEGRFEQTFSTDQDNGLIFEVDDAEAGHVREAFLPFARAVNDKLDRCGIPLCRGKVMAGNPQWCMTLVEWQRTFLGWIHRPDPKALLNAAIFFDLRPIYGTEALADRLRATLLSAAGERPLFLRHMAQNAILCRPPLGTIREFVFDSREFPHTLDLKAHGSRPFVDAARIMALANGIAHTNTAERLRAVEDAVHLGEEALAAIVDGFHFVHLTRLRNQCRPKRALAAENRIDPDDLNDLDRHVLKEAFRQARRLQNRLVLDYQLRE